MLNPRVRESGRLSVWDSLYSKGLGGGGGGLDIDFVFGGGLRGVGRDFVAYERVMCEAR